MSSQENKSLKTDSKLNVENTYFIASSAFTLAAATALHYFYNKQYYSKNFQ